MKRLMPILLLLALASTALAADTAVGVLWSTHTGTLPNLAGSIELAEYRGWELWGDLFLSLEDLADLNLKAAAAGASLAVPPGTPIISPIMDATGATRGGFAGHYDFERDEWGLSFYVAF